jgi:hypothetical protein
LHRPPCGCKQTRECGNSHRALHNGWLRKSRHGHAVRCEAAAGGTLRPPRARAVPMRLRRGSCWAGRGSARFYLGRRLVEWSGGACEVRVAALMQGAAWVRSGRSIVVGRGAVQTKTNGTRTGQPRISEPPNLHAWGAENTPVTLTLNLLHSTYQSKQELYVPVHVGLDPFRFPNVQGGYSTHTDTGSI